MSNSEFFMLLLNLVLMAACYLAGFYCALFESDYAKAAFFVALGISYEMSGGRRLDKIRAGRS